MRGKPQPGPRDVGQVLVSITSLRDPTAIRLELSVRVACLRGRVGARFRHLADLPFLWAGRTAWLKKENLGCRWVVPIFAISKYLTPSTHETGQ